MTSRTKQIIAVLVAIVSLIILAMSMIRCPPDLFDGPPPSPGPGSVVLYRDTGRIDTVTQIVVRTRPVYVARDISPSNVDIERPDPVIPSKWIDSATLVADVADSIERRLSEIEVRGLLDTTVTTEAGPVELSMSWFYGWPDSVSIPSLRLQLPPDSMIIRNLSVPITEVVATKDSWIEDGLEITAGIGVGALVVILFTDRK